MSLEDAASRIRNPLGMIATFAAISEVAMSIAITQLSSELQGVFIWFVMGFPVLLVLLFFYVLYTKPAVFFSPGDYKKEELYVSSIGLQSSDDGVDLRIRTLEDTLASIQGFLSRATLDSAGEDEYRELQRSLSLRQELETNPLYLFLTGELRIDHDTARSLISKAVDGLDLSRLIETELKEPTKANRVAGVVLGFPSAAQDFERLKSVLSREERQQ